MNRGANYVLNNINKNNEGYSYRMAGNQAYIKSEFSDSENSCISIKVKQEN